MTWTNRTRATVPDWVLWARRADTSPDIVGTTVHEDVEHGATIPGKNFKDSDQSDNPLVTTVNVPTIEDDAASVMTKRRSGGKNDSSPALVQVSVLFPMVDQTKLD